MGPLDAARRLASKLKARLDSPPTEEEICGYLQDPEGQPQVQAYLDANPEYKYVLLDLPDEVQKVAETRTKKLARELYLRRVAQGRPGDEESDWEEAQRQLCTELERRLEPGKVPETADSASGCAAASVPPTANK